MIKTRKAILRDIEAIVDLDLKLYHHHDQYHRKDYDYLSDNELRKVLHSRRRSYVFSRQAHVFVAEDNGQLIGFATASIKKRPPMFQRKWSGYIGSIYVEEGYRRHGVGKFLIQEALDWFKKKGIELIGANIDVLNEASVALFKKQGFEVYQYVVLKELKK